MSASAWLEANQRHLATAIAEVRRMLEAARAATAPEPGPDAADDAEPPNAAAPFALDAISAIFDLSSFERRLLVLCAGVELDSALAALCDPAITFSLALAAFPDAHWSAITPQSPLRRWHLLELGSGGSIAPAPLRIDERILHFLAGIDQADERVASVAERMESECEIAASHSAAADRIVAAWSASAGGRRQIEPLQICGSDAVTRRAVAATACARVGLTLYVLSALALPLGGAELDTFIRLCERESWIGGSAFLLECDNAERADPFRLEAVRQFSQGIRAPLLVSSNEGRGVAPDGLPVIDVPQPKPAEQRSLWLDALGDTASRLNGALDRVTAHFVLSPAHIRSIAASLGNDGDPGTAIWNCCRSVARRRMGDLAHRIESAATWDDLVLPELQRALLHDLVTCVRFRTRVYEQWGFGARDSRGLGVTGLFSGPSGTGKTLAAEVISNVLALDLYRIDLSGVVSKYIGETESNLRRIFDAAEEGGAILLFDEADALFGKRSDVKDSHDRYANIEVSYLLQRMEAYRGVAILATNAREALDPAFLRRIRFAVQFPFPGPAERLEIWRRTFPPALPRTGIDEEKLARLAIAGGSIRNIAVNAAFGAARDDAALTMRHLLEAARAEFVKLEKTLPSAETEGWV